MSQENVEIVKRVERIFAAYNRRDWDGFFADIYSESDFEWAPIEENVSYRGREAVLGYVESWFEAWDEFQVEIEDIEIAPAADRVWVALRYRGKGTGSEVPVEGLFFQVSEWRDGKSLRAKEYTDRAEALEAAGLSE